MKAAIFDGGGELEIREVPAPEQNGWALVSVQAAGVCGTELHFLDGMIPPPSDAFVLGHEISGTVAAVPLGSDLVPGDRVAVYNFVGTSSSAAASRSNFRATSPQRRWRRRWHMQT